MVIVEAVALVGDFDLANPWKEIADRLKRDEEELKKTLDDAINRRNDIIHRADREKKAPDGGAQEIGYAWSRQTVDTIRVVCLCLDELVAVRAQELREAAADQSQRVA